MEGNFPGNSGNFRSHPRPSAPGMAFGQLRQVGKDDPQFIHRKAMFSKFPEEWKAKICAESDNVKRLVLFDQYCNQLREQKMEIHRANVNRTHQMTVNQPSQVPNVRMNMSHTAFHPSRQQHAYPAQSFDPSSLNGSNHQSRMIRQVAMNGDIKRVHSPVPQNMEPYVKRERLDETDRFHEEQQQQPSTNQRSPGGTVYIQRRTDDGQVILVPATIVEHPNINNKPIYVQTMTPQGVQQVQARPKQNLVFRNENAIRGIVTATNFNPHSPQASPASSVSSNELDVRVVPDSTILEGRRMITAVRRIKEEPLDRVQEPMRQNMQSYPSQAIRLDQSTPSPPEIVRPSDQEMPTLPRHDADSVQNVNPVKLPMQAVLDELRKNPDYKKMITSIREKYENDLKRILNRALLDGKQPAKAIFQTLQVLNYKAPLPKDKWNSFEPFVKNAIESSGICFPLLQELRRINKTNAKVSPESKPVEKLRELNYGKSIDPWHQFRDQIVQMPQFMVEFMSMEDSADNYI